MFFFNFSKYTEVHFLLAPPIFHQFNYQEVLRVLPYASLVLVLIRLFTISPEVVRQTVFISAF